MTSRADKDERLANRAQVGNRLRAFADDPLITAWFEREIAKATDAMVDASSAGDGPKAIHQGLTVKVLKEVHKAMREAVAAGDRAAEELHKRNNRSDV
jgi:hypothetical protein